MDIPNLPTEENNNCQSSENNSCDDLNDKIKGPADGIEQFEDKNQTSLKIHIGNSEHDQNDTIKDLTNENIENLEAINQTSVNNDTSNNENNDKNKGSSTDEIKSLSNFEVVAKEDLNDTIKEEESAKNFLETKYAQFDEYSNRLESFEGEKSDAEYFCLYQDIVKDIITIRRYLKFVNLSTSIEEYIAKLETLCKKLEDKANPKLSILDTYKRKIELVRKKTESLHNELRNLKDNKTERTYTFYEDTLMEFMKDLDEINTAEYKEVKQNKVLVIRLIKQVFKYLEALFDDNDDENDTQDDNETQKQQIHAAIVC